MRWAAGVMSAVWCLAASGLQRSEDVGRPPNVVLILVDDLGYGELGCYGQSKIRTPNLDRMAAEGIRFTRHYASAPVCAPTRAMLLTGLHSGHSPIRDNGEERDLEGRLIEGQRPLPEGTVTIGARMQELGYATGIIGKWGNGGPGSTGEPGRMGFGFSYGYLCQRQAHNFYPTHMWRDGVREDLEGNRQGNLTGAHYAQDLFIRETLAFVDRNRERPFFLYLPYTIPHVALQTTAEDLVAYAGAFEETPYEGDRGYLKHPTPRAAYAAMITRLDHDVGVLLDRLKALGLDEETLVVFTSDNGPTHDVGGADTVFFESTGGLRGRKGSVWEGGIRVPLIARWPGRIDAGRESGHACATHDLYPTIIEAGMGVAPDGIDGVSFLPTLLGKGEQREPAHLYWEFPGYGGQQAVLIGDWKGVRREMGKGNAEIELFDLSKDERETTDVAREHPEILDRIRGIMQTDRTASEAFPMPLLDATPRKQ